MAPGAVIGRQLGDVCPLWPLPRWVVMVQDRWAAAKLGRDGARGREVHRDRAEVLDHDEIRVLERAGDTVGGRRLACAQLEAPHDAVDRTLARNGDHLEAEIAENPVPGTAHDGDPVTAAQPERDDRAAGHSRVTLLSDRVAGVMRAHWQPEGYTVPSSVTYPFGWLWDSCFHALIWMGLGEADRSIAELRHLFRLQDDDGFVPHIDYERDPAFHARFWGRLGASVLTQPPVHGHVIAELGRGGVEVPDELRDRSSRHIRWFLEHRSHPSGLVAARHPWETGCDDSPRFDHWGAADPARWFDVKGTLVRELPDNGFDCAPVSLGALVAWSALELGVEHPHVEELVGALVSRWDSDLSTYVDAGAASRTSGQVRTLEGLLPALVDTRVEAIGAMDVLVARYGPRGVHPDEPSYEPDRYWRGGVWPQLAYLVWRAGADVAAATVRGAITSGLAEYWSPEDGAGLGAAPQSWAGLAILMEGHSGV